MGYVTFQSRHEDHQNLHTHFLWTLEDTEELNGILPGDSVKLHIDIDAKTYSEYEDKGILGIRASKKPESLPLKGSDYEVEIMFVVKRRVHQINRDWMSNYIGFRLSSTTVFLETMSDEAEKLFSELQSQNNQYEHDFLYQ
jgi:hypothetical protein